MDYYTGFKLNFYKKDIINYILNIFLIKGNCRKTTVYKV